MRPLKILHVTPYFADAWAYGGIPRIAHSLARGLARRGHQVTVCTTDVCDASARSGAPRRYETADGVEVRTFANLSNRLAYHWQLFLPRGLRAFLKRRAASFDVAHLHACRNLPGVIAARQLRRAGVPYILAPNGTSLRIERRRLAKLVFDLGVGTRVVEGATRVLAVSPAEQTQLAGAGVDGRRVCVIPNPIDVEEFTEPLARGAFRAHLGCGRRPMVLFLGKLTPRKRLDTVVDAFARMNRDDGLLVVAGNDMGAEASTRAAVRRFGLESRTVFTGLLEGRRRIDALADADVVVYPSEYEIFGLVPLEAMLAGTPVVVADDSGCGQVVGSLGGGQVVPLGDADAVAAAIDRVLAAPDDWRARADAAKRLIRARFGADEVSRQMEALYGEVVSGAEFVLR